jgi:hypothetical protein
MNYSFMEKLGDPISGKGSSIQEMISDTQGDPDGSRDIMKTAARNAGDALKQAASGYTDKIRNAASKVTRGSLDKAFTDQLNNLTSQGINAIEGRLNRLLLGNVYGFSADAFLSDPIGQTLNTLQTGVVNAFSPKHNNAPSKLGNAFKI